MDLRVHEGEVVAVIGSSGAGKSSFLRLLDRLDEPTGGTVHLDGERPRLEPDDHATDPVTPDPEPTGFESPSNGEQPAGTEAVDRLSGRVGDLTERIAALEGRIEERSPAEGSFSDPDLVSKMVHACMESERVSEEEELRILRRVLTTGRPADS